MFLLDSGIRCVKIETYNGAVNVNDPDRQAF